MITRTVVGIACLLSFGSAAIWCQVAGDQAKKVVPPELTCSRTADACGLAEPKMTARYQALAALFVKNGEDFSFSADVLAAVLGTTEHGKKWNLDPSFPLTVPRIGELYREARRYPSDPFEGSAYVVVNVAGIGPKAYDADVMRLLLWTELFPDRLQVVKRKNNGSLGEYVLVRRAAAEIITSSFRTPTKDSFNKGAAAAQSTMPGLATAFARLPVGDESVTLGPPLTLTPFELLSEEQKKSESPHRRDWTGCEVRFEMSIPRRPAHRYTGIDLQVRINNPTDADARLCGPPRFDITAEETTENRNPCDRDREVTWRLSGRVLERNSSKNLPFALFVEYPINTTNSNLALDLFLVGYPKDSTDTSPPPAPWSIRSECK
jgi:hypothetical protein